MSDKIGWVRIYRKIQDCEIWETDEPFDRRSAWVDLLLMANHKDKNTLFNGHPITIKRGQRLTSIRKLSNHWNWSYKRTVSFLNLLEELGMIIRESDNTKSLLTIVNYGIYNDSGITNDSTNDSTDYITNDSTEESLTEAPRNHSRHTNKNDKNDKNEENDKNEKNEKKREGKPTRSRYGEYSHVLLTDDDHNKLIDQLGEHNTSEYIKKVDEYCQQTGKTYKDYYLTILNWWRKDRGHSTDTKSIAEEMEAKINNVWKFGGE